MFERELATLAALPATARVAERARFVGYTIILGCACAGLLLALTTDLQILVGSFEIRLPLLAASVPIQELHSAVAVVLLLVYTSFHMCLRQLWDEPANRPVDGRATTLKAWVSIFVAWWWVPLTLLAFWYRSLVRQELRAPLWHILCVSVAVVVGVASFRRARRSVSRAAAIELPATLRSSLALVALAAAAAVVRWAPVLFGLTSAWSLITATQALIVDSASSHATLQCDASARAGSPSRRLELRARSLRLMSAVDCTFPGANFALADLTGANLARADLSEGDFDRATLRSARIAEAKLDGAKLHGARLQRADLRATHLIRADLQTADLEGANLLRADLRAANLTRARLRQANLTEANLSGANLSGVDLSHANLTAANLTRANIAYANLTHADLTNANLTGAKLVSANLSDARLTDANLEHAVLTQADLSRADLRGARLEHAQFERADLVRASLQRTSLERAGFERANLKRASLAGADLSGADLRGADLTDADLEGARYDDSTGFPARFDPGAQSMRVGGPTPPHRPNLARVPEESAMNAIPLAATGAIEWEVPDWLERALAAPARRAANRAPIPCSAVFETGALQALAAPERAIVLCCDDAAGDFAMGCLGRERCGYLISTDTGWSNAANETQLAAVIGPATSSAEALGRVALIAGQDLFVQTRRAREEDGFAPYGAALPMPAVSVERTEVGYTLVVPTKHRCGCNHPLEFTRFDVRADGTVTQGERELLLADHVGICSD